MPFVKDAFLTAKLGRHTLLLGLIGTPLYDTLDEFWGYRPMEKTPIDLFKFGNSREFGVGMKGALDARGKLTYTVVVRQRRRPQVRDQPRQGGLRPPQFPAYAVAVLRSVRRLHRHGQRQLGQHPAGFRRRQGKMGAQRPQFRVAPLPDNGSRQRLEVRLAVRRLQGQPHARRGRPLRPPARSQCQRQQDRLHPHGRQRPRPTWCWPVSAGR